MCENKGKKLDSEEKQGSQCRGRSVCARSRREEAEASRPCMDVYSGGRIVSKGPKISVLEKGHRRHEKKSPVSNREASEATGDGRTVLQDSPW